MSCIGFVLFHINGQWLACLNASHFRVAICRSTLAPHEQLQTLVAVGLNVVKSYVAVIAAVVSIDRHTVLHKEGLDERTCEAGVLSSHH